MVRCAECGENFPRLQWTHFKYKCNGRLSFNEYKVVHPTAPLVDEELKKKCAVSLANLKSKYGDEEGSRKWKEYRDKQALTNTYEYKKQMYGWSLEQFNEYNKSRAVTLNNLVKKIWRTVWVE